MVPDRLISGRDDEGGAPRPLRLDPLTMVDGERGRHTPLGGSLYGIPGMGKSGTPMERYVHDLTRPPSSAATSWAARGPGWPK